MKHEHPLSLITDFPLLEYKEQMPHVIHNEIDHPSNRLSAMHDILNAQTVLLVRALHLNGTIGGILTRPALSTIVDTVQDGVLILNGIKSWVEESSELKKQLFNQMRTRERVIWERNNYIILDLENKIGSTNSRPLNNNDPLLREFQTQNKLVQVSLPRDDNLKYKLFKKEDAPDPDIPSLFNPNNIIDDTVREIDGVGSNLAATDRSQPVDVSKYKSTGQPVKSLDDVIADITKALEDN